MWIHGTGPAPATPFRLVFRRGNTTRGRGIFGWRGGQDPSCIRMDGHDLTPSRDLKIKRFMTPIVSD